MKNTILIGMCIALGAGILSVRAADTPVQAAARAALLQNLNKVDLPQNEPSPETNTPPSTNTPPVTAAAQPAQTVTNAVTNVTAAVPDQAAPLPTALPTTRTEAAAAATVPVAASETQLPPAAPATVPPTPAKPAPAAQVPNTPPTVARATVPPAAGARATQSERAGPATASDHHPRMTLSMVFVLLAVLVPLTAFAGATIWQRRQRRRLDQSLLSDPAASALIRARSIQADQMVERVENDIFAACGSCALAAIGAVVIGLWLPRPLSAFISPIFLAGFAFLGGFLMFRAMRRFRAVQNIRLAPVDQPRIVSRAEPVAAKEREGKPNREPARMEQQAIVLTPEPLMAKDTQADSNGVTAVTKELQARLNGEALPAEKPRGGLNGKVVVTKPRVVKRRKTVSPRSKVRAEPQ